MSVRRSICRYSEPPYGADEADVINRAKRWFKDGEFMITRYGATYSANRPSLPPFKNPENARVFKKIGRNWVEQ